MRVAGIITAALLLVAVLLAYVQFQRRHLSGTTVFSYAALGATWKGRVYVCCNGVVFELGPIPEIARLQPLVPIDRTPLFCDVWRDIDMNLRIVSDQSHRFHAFYREREIPMDVVSADCDGFRIDP